MATAPLGREFNQIAIQVRAKPCRLFADLHAGREAEHLKAAAVGENRSVPTHELVQAAKLLDNSFPRPQGQMIGVGQNHLRAGAAQHFDFHSLHRGQRANRHERRHFDRAVRRDERRPPRRGLRIGAMQREGKRLAHWDRRRFESDWKDRIIALPSLDDNSLPLT